MVPPPWGDSRGQHHHNRDTKKVQMDFPYRLIISGAGRRVAEIYKTFLTCLSFPLLGHWAKNIVWIIASSRVIKTLQWEGVWGKNPVRIVSPPPAGSWARTSSYWGFQSPTQKVDNAVSSLENRPPHTHTHTLPVSRHLKSTNKDNREIKQTQPHVLTSSDIHF
jgi:hypothetical protein